MEAKAVCVGLWGDPLADSVRAQRARKREEAAAAAAGGAESAAATPAPAEPEPVEPEIVVPPAPTDEEVEEAKKEHDTKMQVLKDEVSRLQGDKTKLFQQLKQQCAPAPAPPAVPPANRCARRQQTNPSATPRSPGAATDRAQQPEPAAAAATSADVTHTLPFPLSFHRPLSRP